MKHWWVGGALGFEGFEWCFEGWIGDWMTTRSSFLALGLGGIGGVIMRNVHFCGTLSSSPVCEVWCVRWRWGHPSERGCTLAETHGVPSVSCNALPFFSSPFQFFILVDRALPYAI